MCYVDVRILTEAPEAKSLFVQSSSGRCPKCGTTKKSDTRSCCARGGAWFKNCGDVGDTKFDHTWSEGIQACEKVVSNLLIESPRRAELLNVTAIDRTKDTGQQDTKINCSYIQNSMSNAGVMDCEYYDGHARVSLCIYILAMVTSHF